MFDDKDTQNLSSTEYMMRYCRSHNYNFQLLLNNPLFPCEPTSETYTNDKEEHKIESMLDFNQKEMEKQKDNILLVRTAMSLNDNQKYMISFAWVNPKELYLLQTFLEVIMINTIE